MQTVGQASSVLCSVTLLLSSGSSNNWWERSPNSGNSNNFCNVNSNGNANNNNANNSNGVAFGFCKITGQSK